MRWLLTLTLLALVACAPGANEAVNTPRPDGDSAGFFLGVWHGGTIGITFIVSLFKDSVGVYEAHNTGWPYNLGFVIGVMSAFGGAGASKTRRRAREE